MNPLPMIFFILALGFIATSLYQQTAQRELSIEADAIMTSITQIARAQHLYYSQNPANGYAAAKGDDTTDSTYTEQMTVNLLPNAWNASLPHATRYATRGHNNTPTSPGFEVTYNGIAEYASWTGPAPTAAAITRAATRFGPIACTADFTGATPVCSTNRVQGLIVNFARSIDMTLVDEFLPLNAERPMFGDLTINDTFGAAGTVKSQLTAAGSLNLFNTPGPTPETQLTADGKLNLGFTWTDADNDDVFDYSERDAGAGGFFFSGGTTPEYVMVVAGQERIRTNSTQTEFFSTANPNIKIIFEDGRIQDVVNINNVGSMTAIEDIFMTNTGEIDGNEATFNALKINP